MEASRRTPPGVSAWHRGKPGGGCPTRTGLRAPRPPLPSHPQRPGVLPRAASPQLCQPRDPRCPAPACPGLPAGSLRCPFHIRKRPYKSRFRRRHPAPYLVIPVPARRGRGALAREPGCRRDVRAPARPPPGRESERLRRRADSAEALGTAWVVSTPPSAAGSRQGFRHRLVLGSRCSLPLVPVGGPRAGSRHAAFPGCWQCGLARAARSRERRPPALRSSAEIEGALYAALHRDSLRRPHAMESRRRTIAAPAVLGAL